MLAQVQKITIINVYVSSAWELCPWLCCARFCQTEKKLFLLMKNLKTAFERKKRMDRQAARKSKVLLVSVPAISFVLLLLLMLCTFS